MEQVRNHTRRIPLEPEFMDKGINDVVFGKLSSEATYNPDKNVLYITVSKARPLYREIAKQQQWKQVRTVKTHLNNLIGLGYIQEEKMMLNDKDTDVLTFRYEKNGNEYEIIDKDLLRLMSNALSQNSIKIYAYLRHRQRCFKNEYIFTYRELARKLGYSDTTHACDTKISDILFVLRKVGLIDYEEFTEEIEENGRYFGVKKHKLTFIAESVDELDGYND